MVRPSTTHTADDLSSFLASLDRKSYSAYKDLRHRSGWPIARQSTLTFDRIQSDPYAPASRLRVTHALDQFPKACFRSDVHTVALTDFLLRKVFAAFDQSSRADCSRSCAFQIYEPGQNVLRRSALVTTDKGFEVRVRFALPAKGRSIEGRRCAALLEANVRKLEDALRYSTWPAHEQERLDRFLRSVCDQSWLRRELKSAGLVTFIPNGARLARASGFSDLPADRCVAFQSPQALQVQFTLPESGLLIAGMGIPSGLTVLVGGGFHGKSTLLNAIRSGVYDKIPGDGREFLVSDFTAVTVEAESGRSVQCVDISALIRSLPHGQSTTCFTTKNASGSTSQSASLMEALEIGSKLILLDEDSCATNLLYRDAQMSALVDEGLEPIRPLSTLIKSLEKEFLTSFILVLGSSGAFFSAADLVIQMTDFVPHDVTARAKAIVASPGPQTLSAPPALLRSRTLAFAALRDTHRMHLARKILTFQDDVVLSLTALHQIIEEGQVKCIVELLQNLVSKEPKRTTSLRAFADRFEDADLDAIAIQRHGHPVGDYASFRSATALGANHLCSCRYVDLVSAVNRYSLAELTSSL